MKTSKLVVLVAVATFGIQALAKTDVKAAVQQLKANEENSKANRKQYEDNAEIS